MSKICTRCNKEKDESLFKDKRNKETKTCKPCREWRMSYMIKKGYAKGTGHKITKHEYVEGIEMKKCSKCKILKPLELFSKQKSKKDGFKSQCKSCIKISISTKEEKEKSALRHKNYYSKNSEKLKERSATWYQNNKERFNERSRKYYKKRRLEDPAYKITCNLRSRLYNAIRSQKGTKCDFSLNLIGCSVSFLMKYLENKFEEGMSWENYGEWHIDHIKPCAEFNLLIEEEQLKCFHYFNLQPLWAEENILKRDSWTKEQNLYWETFTIKGL